jgi:translocation and assembly module TamB
VARFLPQTKLEGLLNGQIIASWGGEGVWGNMVVRCDAVAEQFAFASPVLGDDVVQLPQVRAAGQVTKSGDRVDIEKTALECDLGNITLAGSANLGGESRESTLSALMQQRLELSGKVDLARLAAMLPGTLHIRKETRITSGQLQVAFTSRERLASAGSAQANNSDQNVMAWQGQIVVDNLMAMDNGRQFSWVKPIAVSLDAHDTAQGPVVDSLQCDSDFLKIHAAGTLDDLAASLSFDLKRLADQLGQFVDLGSIRLAGDGWGNVNWKRNAQGEFETDAELQLHNLKLVLPEKQPWREESLLVYCSAKGKTDGTANTRFDAATVNLKAGEDRLAAELLQPVADLRAGGAWPVRVLMQGQLQSWTARLASFLPLDDWRISGTVDLDVQATGSNEGVNIGQARINASQFALASPYINMEEPKVELTAVGSWNQQQYRLQLAPATLATTSLAMQADNFLLSMAQNGPFELSGTVKYQGDLARLSQWFVDRSKPPAWNLGGQLAGNAQFKQSAGVVQCETAAEVHNLMVVDSSGGAFQEPLVQLSARGDYETKSGIVKLEQAQIASSFIAANALGQAAWSDDRTQANIEGQISYDLERICGLLRPYLGQNIRFVGRGSGPASWRGPLSLTSGQANAAIKWDRAFIYGFRFKEAEIKPTLADGVLKIEPLEVSVSQGKMYLAPVVHLASEPKDLTLPAGPLVRQVEIEPQMCAGLLKYVAPVLAEVTSAQGTFSIELDGCRLPLNDPAKGELAGKFIIHSIEIGPGPLIRELATLMGREAPAKLRKESVVPFRMVNGRVYHQGLELIFPDFTVRTYGSVGFDQTLAIMTEMPVPPKWLENNPLAPALRNQTIRIPLGGTLKRPQLDRATMDQLSRQFIRSAARNMLEEGLNKGLDQLFKQQKKE